MKFEILMERQLTFVEQDNLNRDIVVYGHARIPVHPRQYFVTGGNQESKAKPKNKIVQRKQTDSKNKRVKELDTEDRPIIYKCFLANQVNGWIAIHCYPFCVKWRLDAKTI